MVTEFRETLGIISNQSGSYDGVRGWVEGTVPHFIEILGGSFSAVSKLNFASAYGCCIIFSIYKICTLVPRFELNLLCFSC